MTLYFLRHGRTEAHAKRLACGSGWDPPLSAEGREQLRGLTPPKGAKVLCSPLRRARETAQLLGLKPTIEHDLAEQDLGEWEGKPWADIEPRWRTEDPPGGESRADFSARIAQLIHALRLEPGPVLLISHGGVWRELSRQLRLPARDAPSAKLLGPFQTH